MNSYPLMNSQNAYQLNDMATYNYDTSSPQYQLIQQYQDRMRNSQQAYYNTMQEHMLKQQAAAQAQAQAQASANEAAQQAALADYISRTTIGPTSISDLAYSTPVSQAPEQEAPGFLGQVLHRGVPQTVGTVQGGLGALADFVGFDDVGRYLTDAAADKFAYAEANAPRQVGSIEDIRSLGDAGTWMVETAADFVPTIAGAALTGGTSAVAAGSSTAGRALFQNAAKNLTKRQIQARAAEAGVLGFTGVAESGSAFLENIENQGYNDASSGRALLTGAASAAITKFLGAEIPLLRSLTGVAGTKAADEGIKRAIIRGMRTGAFREGGEEALQETVQIVNSMISDERAQVTGEDLSRVYNAFFGGAFLGGPMGGVTGYANARKAKADATTPIAPEDDSTALDFDTPFTTPEEREQQGLEIVVRSREEALAKIEANKDAQLAPYLSEIERNRQTLYKYSANPSPEVLKKSDKQRNTEINAAQRMYFDNMAQVARINEEYETNKAAAIKDADVATKKLNKTKVNDAVIAQANLFYADPVAFGKMKSQARDAITFTNRQEPLLRERSKQLQSRKSDLRQRIRELGSVRNPNMRLLDAVRTELKAIESEIDTVRRTTDTLTTAASKIQKMINKPTADFTPAMLEAQLSKINNSNIPASVRDARTLVDDGEYSIYSSANNIMREDREAMAQQMEALNAQLNSVPQQTQDSPWLTPFAQQPDYMLDPMMSNALMGRQQRDFAQTPDSFLQQQPLNIQGGALFPETPDTFLQPQGPAPFSSTPDSFLQGTPQVTPNTMPPRQAAPAPFPTTPDNFGDRAYAGAAMSTSQAALPEGTGAIPMGTSEPTREQYLKDRWAIQHAGVDIFSQRDPNAEAIVTPDPRFAMGPGTNGVDVRVLQARVAAMDEARVARDAYLSERWDIQKQGQAPVEELGMPAFEMPPAVERPMLPESTSGTGRNFGTTPISKQVHTLIQSGLKQLPGLGRATVIVDNVDQLGLSNVDTSSLGIYDPASNRVYLIAENIEAAVRVQKNLAADKNPTSKDLKQMALKTLVHEGVAHYGLSVVMTPGQRTAFLNSVSSSFAKNKLYQQTAKDYAGQPPMVIAEEFVARLAESYTINKLLQEDAVFSTEKLSTTDPNSSQTKRLFQRFKNIISKVLEKVGIVKVTNQDVLDVLKASASRLSRDTTQTTMSSPLVREGEVVSSLPTTMGPNERQAIGQQENSILNTIRNTDRSELALTLKEQIVDSKAPIEKFMKDAKAAGMDVNIANNLYKNMQNMPNATAAEIEKFSTDYVLPLYRAVVEMTPDGVDASVTFAQAADYVTAKAAIERNRELGEGAAGKGFSTPESLAIIEKLASPEMDRVSDMLQDLNEARLTILEDNNLLPKGTVGSWLKKWDLYMPLKTWDAIQERDNPQWFNSMARRNLSMATRQTRIMSKATGTNKELDNAITHAILQAYDVIAYKHNAEAGRSLLKLIEDNPTYTDFFELDSMYTPEDPNVPVTRTVKDDGTIKYKKHKFKAESFPDQSVQLIDKDGNRIKVIIKDKGVVRAFKGENVAQISKPMRAMSDFRRALGKLFTVYSPEFWLRNALRDAATAVLNMADVQNSLARQGVPGSASMSKAILQKGLATMLSSKGIRAAIQKAVLTDGRIDNSMFKNNPEMIEYMKYWDDFVKYGAKSSYFSTGGYDQLNVAIAKDLQNMKPNTKSQEIRSKMNNLATYMEAVSDAFENQTRYIAFVETVKALEATGMKPTDARIRAANIALNLTVNFSRKGAMAPAFDALYMFASASIAGNARLLQTVLRRDKTTGKLDLKYLSKFLTLPAIAYTAQAMIGRAMMEEDEDGVNKYDKIPDYVKANNIIIPLFDGKYVTIPIAYGLNMFWNLARNMSDSLYAAATGTKGPSFTEAAKNVITASFDNFTPMGSLSGEGITAFVPTIFRPMAQLAMNKNFAGNPIMPDSTHLVRGELPDSQKAWSSTGPVYKMLAEGINELFGGSATRSGAIDISPETIEHLMTAYLGGFGRIAGNMANSMVKLQQGTYTNDDTLRLPVINAFLKAPQDSDTTALFTRARMELQTQLNTVEESRKNPSLSTKQRVDITRENQAGLRAKDFLSRSQKQLNDIRSKERQIAQNNSMPQETKNKYNEQLRQRKLAIMKRLIKRAAELGVRIN